MRKLYDYEWDAQTHIEFLATYLFDDADVTLAEIMKRQLDKGYDCEFKDGIFRYYKIVTED